MKKRFLIVLFSIGSLLLQASHEVLDQTRNMSPKILCELIKDLKKEPVDERNGTCHKDDITLQWDRCGRLVKRISFATPAFWKFDAVHSDAGRLVLSTSYGDFWVEQMPTTKENITFLTLLGRNLLKIHSFY